MARLARIVVRTTSPSAAIGRADLLRGRRPGDPIRDLLSERARKHAVEVWASALRSPAGPARVRLRACKQERLSTDPQRNGGAIGQAL
jgi:hypothetical protein